MKQILAFVTPCQPLTERCKFSIRVFTSWISSGLVLGWILALFSLGSKTPNPSGLFFNLLLTTPIAICTLGFIGLAIGLSRGDNNYHAGWYWYFFPIVTYLVIGFWITFAIFAFSLSLAGVNLPKPHPPRRRDKVDPEKFREELENIKVEDLLEEFEEQLKDVEKKDDLKAEEKQVVRKLKSLDRSKLRSSLSDALNEDEMEILFILLLRLLGFELR